MPFGYEDRDVVDQDPATEAVPGAVPTDPEDVDLAHGGIAVGLKVLRQVGSA